jgi:protoporphyrinogen oxidase
VAARGGRGRGRRVREGTEVGGLAGSFAVGDGAGGPVLEKFYHHIFRTDRDVIRLIGEMGLAERLEWRTPATSTLRDGRIYRMDGAFADAAPAPVRALLRPLIGTSLDTLVALLRFGTGAAGRPAPVRRRRRVPEAAR